MRLNRERHKLPTIVVWIEKCCISNTYFSRTIDYVSSTDVSVGSFLLVTTFGWKSLILFFPGWNPDRHYLPEIAVIFYISILTCIFFIIICFVCSIKVSTDSLQLVKNHSTKSFLVFSMLHVKQRRSKFMNFFIKLEVSLELSYWWTWKNHILQSCTSIVFQMTEQQMKPVLKPLWKSESRGFLFPEKEFQALKGVMKKHKLCTTREFQKEKIFKNCLKWLQKIIPSENLIKAILQEKLFINTGGD